jgi:WS/DGAT/MGAT family acyltransferase
MTPLGALDALFLHLETPSTPMHVGALHLLDADVSADALFEAIGRHLRARLSASPVFTRRLRAVPLAIANPLWIDASPDLSHHFQRVRLPAPGTRRQLDAVVSRLHAQRLDRRRPLWQFVLIEGLDDGGCAFYTKVHHAAIDGAAGVALAQALLDASPVTADPAADSSAAPRASEEDPDELSLLAAMLAHNGRAGVDLVRRVPSLAGDAFGRLRGAGGMLAAMARHVSLAPATVFNDAIDGGRSVATVSLPLGPLQEVAAAREVTVNDVVLALVGGALRRYLEARDELPDKPLLAAMPVSLRAQGNTQMNTQATMAQASLGTDCADPLERLRTVHAAAGTAKSISRGLRPAFDLSLPSIGMPWLLTAAAAAYGGGLARRLPRLANVVVSNVPGPAQPLYLAGARLRTWWPLSIVEHGLGLNITVMRYIDSLDFGLVAAKRLVHDAAPIAAFLGEASDELVAAALPKTARRRRTATDSPASAPRQARPRASRRPRGLPRAKG